MNPRFVIHQFTDGWCIFDLQDQRYVRHVGGTHIVLSSQERAKTMLDMLSSGILGTQPKPINFTIKPNVSFHSEDTKPNPDCSAVVVYQMKDETAAGSRECGTCHKHTTEGFVVTDYRRHLSEYFRFVCSPCSLAELAA